MLNTDLTYYLSIYSGLHFGFGIQIIKFRNVFISKQTEFNYVFSSSTQFLHLKAQELFTCKSVSKLNSLNMSTSGSNGVLEL